MSSRRTDYWYDPQAPVPNSLVPGACALVTDEHGRILMQRRRDSGNWSMPGGTMEIGETLARTAVRETREETGLDIELTGILGIYTDPHHVIAYSDGETRQEFVIAYTARILGGRLATSDESTDVRFINPDELDDLPVHESTRLRLEHWRTGNTPYLGQQ
jgi:8-oxo-dGTP pyrophosphatase MutT (NUDIX family)